ncbi:DisA bacterial checkpoint controller nucleotide-binding protein [uncultured archaeon]|nr:DisA bacterial checkpoint controller nucleotide-binding protein [uncultured archaeon]
MGKNVLLDDGRNIVKRAESAQERGDLELARELYIRAIARFKNAAEITDDFSEISVIRSLISYYQSRLALLQSKLGSIEVRKPQVNESSQNDIIELLKGTGVNENVFEAVIKIALEISTEGREGRSIGTAFLLGDSENVMAKSRQLIMNPFQGYKREEKLITDPEIRDNIKEFAQLDGAFVVTGDGVVEAAGRYITLDTGMVKLQKGLGTRHSSVAAITQRTDSIGVVISQSGGIIRIFRQGRIVATVRP